MISEAFSLKLGSFKLNDNKAPNIIIERTYERMDIIYPAKFSNSVPYILMEINYIYIQGFSRVFADLKPL